MEEDNILSEEDPTIIKDTKVLNMMRRIGERVFDPKSLIGEYVELFSKPDGFTSREYDVKVGEKYKVIGFDGSCVRIKTPEGEATIWRGRFKYKGRIL